MKFYFVVSTEVETTLLEVTFAKVHNIGEIINAPVNVIPHYTLYELTCPNIQGVPYNQIPLQKVGNYNNGVWDCWGRWGIIIMVCVKSPVYCMGI